MTLKITFMRHAESEGNKAGVVQGRMDFPLTTEGQQQVQALAAQWQAAELYFDEIYCSNLTRARQSADPIAEALNIPITYLETLAERNFGSIEGIPGNDFLDRLQKPRSLSPFKPSLGETAGESEWAIHQRAGLFLQELTTKTKGRYLVVSHGGFLNVLLRVISGLAPSSAPYAHHFKFKNLGRLTAEYDPESGHWSILAFE